MSDFHGSKHAPEIKSKIITTSANACPIAVRLAWHASGTYDKNDNTGGSNGASMRFAPESTDGANAGLEVIRGMLSSGTPIEGLSTADLWVLGGAYAVEFAGGPKIPVCLGREDVSDGSKCPPNGRLPDATQGAQHLRDVFYRMGFNDQEIVALSGAHTLGRCHRVRSGFDGPWTTKPLVFDNEYFKNILDLEWKEVTIEETGNKQFADVATGKLMMLPTDMALKTDEKFLPFTQAYAKDQDLFFKDFSAAFSKLLHLGTVQPTASDVNPEQEKKDAEMREAAMHGSVDVVKSLVSQGANVASVESATGRGALHKAAYWGHNSTVEFLLSTGKVDANGVDCNGDLPLHDAARFGHTNVIKLLLPATKNVNQTNKAGQTPKQVAEQTKQDHVLGLF
jgi:catalase (peroxidase I)